MYLLNVKPKKVDTSDYQILKMNHPSFILECTTRAPSSGEKANKFASQIKQKFFVTPIMTLNLTLLEMRKSKNTNAK